MSAGGDRRQRGRAGAVGIVAAVAGLTAVAGLAAVLVAAPAGAQTPDDAPRPGLELTVTAADDAFAPGESIPLTATVTNAGDAACSLATHPDAALRVEAMTRDGDPVTPELTHALYDAGLPESVAEHLRAVEPGAQVELTRTLAVMEADTQRLLLTDVEPLPDGDALLALWPVDGPARYEVTLRYEVMTLDAEPAVCAGSSAPVTVAFTVGDAAEGGVPWLLLVGGLLALAVVAALVWLVVRRGRRRRTTAAALVLVLAAGWTTAVPPPAAQARLVIPLTPPGFAGAVDACIDGIRAANHDPETQRVIDWATDPDTPPITIVHTDGGSNTFDTPVGPGRRGSSSVAWNPDSRTEYEPGVARDPCTALFHELVHAMRYGDRSAAGREREMCGATGIPTEEVIATFLENAYRRANGLPERTTYRGHALPSSLDECDEPTPPPPPGPERIGGDPTGDRFCEGVPGDGCAESNGDPHLTTFDGVRYSPQAVGELVLVEAMTGDAVPDDAAPDAEVPGAEAGEPGEDADADADALVVQARQRPLGPSRTVAVNSAVAAQVGADRVTVTLEAHGLVVRHDGVVLLDERGVQHLPGGGTVERGPSSRRWAPDSARVTWPDGSAVQVDPIGAAGLRVAVRLSVTRAGTVRGLLGDFDGVPEADLTTRDGVPVTDLRSRETLYDELVDSWRVTEEESLFDYADGDDTATHTDRSFPDEVLTVDDLDPDARERAAAACTIAGVTDEVSLAQCTLDVAASGLLVFASVAGEAQRDLTARTSGEGEGGGGTDEDPGPTLTFDGTVTTLPLDGDRATVDLTAPGALARVTFEATAGQIVYVAFTGATIPAGCGSLSLLGPGDATLRTGCLDADGTGELDRTVLEEPGTYAVVVDPVGDATGRVSLRVVTVTDDVRTAELGGAPVTVTVGQPGAHGRVVFDALAGDRVFVEADPATGATPVPDGCGVLTLVGPEWPDGQDGPTLRTGCVGAGVGEIDALLLERAGPHVVVVDPSAAGAGSLRVRLVEVQDQVGRLTVGGPAVDVEIAQPGARGVLGFTAEAGQALVVEVSASTLPGQCGAVRITDADGAEMRSGCLGPGAEEIRWVPPASGTYSVVVDPASRRTGDVSIALREDTA